METTQTQTPTPTPTQPQTVNGNSILAEMKQTISDIETHKVPDPSPGGTPKTPGGTGLSDQEFLNTNKHTKDPLFSLPNAPGTPSTPGTTSKPLTQVIANSGKFATTLIHEMAVPALAVWVLAFFRKQTNREGWKVTKEDKDILVPAWEGYLASVNVNFDKPIYQLMIAIAFCYGSKFMEGTIKIEDKKRTTAGSVAKDLDAMPDKVTKENFPQALMAEREELILATNRKRKNSRKSNIKWLEETGAFKRLEQALRDKYNIPA